MFVPAFGDSVSGYDFGLWGGRDGHVRVMHKFSIFAGAHLPPTCGQKGGSLGHLVRRGPVSPDNLLEKK